MDWSSSPTTHKITDTSLARMLIRLKLCRIRILILIHHDITESFLIILQHILLCLKQLYRFHAADHQSPMHCWHASVSRILHIPLQSSDGQSHPLLLRRYSSGVIISFFAEDMADKQITFFKYLRIQSADICRYPSSVSSDHQYRI